MAFSRQFPELAPNLRRFASQRTITGQKASFMVFGDTVSGGKMTNVDVFQWAAVVAEGSAEVGRKTIAGLGASLKRVQIKAGAVAERHSHPHEQFVIILEGGGRLECEAGPVVLRPDTVLHFASGAWHSAVFDTDTVLLEVNLAA